MNKAQILERDREILRAVVASAKAGLDVAPLYAQAATSNAIVRCLCALGLEARWFTLGPFHGWYIEGERFWTALDAEKKELELTAEGARLVELLQLIVGGDAVRIRRLWRKVCGAP